MDSEGRKVIIPVDPLDYSEYAFDCKYIFCSFLFFFHKLYKQTKLTGKVDLIEFWRIFLFFLSLSLYFS